MNQSLCSHPWKAMAVRPNGLVIPCCRFNQQGLDTYINSGDNLRNSDIWKTIRLNMLQGKLIKGCNKCYEEEKIGITSLRQTESIDFDPIDNRALPIENLEIAFSNLCNLACVHCSSFFSTKWYSIDVLAGRATKSAIATHSTSFKDWDLSKVTRLKIIGGEPMMEQEKFIELMSSIDLSNVVLEINTNGTILPNDILKSYIDKCKRVYFCVSIDGLKSVNDWYRWPSNFDSIVANMQTYNKWWAADKSIDPLFHNIQLMIHHVCNMFSVIELEEFIDYVELNLPNWRINWDWISHPQWQTIESLPEEYKQQLIEKFKIAAGKYKTNKKTRAANPYLVAIHYLKNSAPVQWEQVKRHIEDTASERKLDFFAMVPKLKNIW